MAEPGGPRAVIGDSSEAGNPCQPVFRIATSDGCGCFMDYGLVESGAPASCLIDQVRGDTVTHEIGLPAFAPVRRRFQTGSGVTGSMHHDDGGNLRCFMR